MLVKEYRICMPLTVEEYRIGQLYMIAKHSAEESEKGEGVEVVENRPHTDPLHGEGQYTEKRIHISSKLPAWLRSMVPKIFYVTEKAWNYYPFTITEYSCSFIPRFSVHILTRYENNNGSTENCLDVSKEVLDSRVVDFVDIALDQCAPHHYKEEEDLLVFRSAKTGRGPLCEGWREDTEPIMCSYKLVEVKLEMMFMSKVEEFVQRAIREILLVGHRQAFAWIDEWFGLSIEGVREYEARMQAETNEKVGQQEALPEGEEGEGEGSCSTPSNTPTSPTGGYKRGWFSSWSSKPEQQ